MKRQLIQLAVLVPAIGLLISCSRNPRCQGEDKNTGIISSSITIPAGCEPAGEQFIITADSTYKQTFSSTCTLPAIDFDMYTLLGLYAQGSCEVKFIREVTREDSESKYHYKVTVKDCGSCKKLGYSYNWVTVPKLPAGWTVTFEVKEK